MSARLNAYDFTVLACIVIALLANFALYSGRIVVRSAGIEFATTGTSPGGNAPGVTVTPNAADLAELDDRPDLPGTYVAPQGRRHTAGVWPLRERVPYCEPDDINNLCYASKPPSSGLHLPVQQNLRLDGGARVDLPPNPGVYNIEFPREMIPHLQEHAGVFVGYNCVSDACREAVEEATLVVQQQLSLGARVVFAPFGDLDEDTFGLASWTRVDTFAASEYADERVRAFIQAHSCRFDPEGFCRSHPVN